MTVLGLAMLAGGPLAWGTDSTEASLKRQLAAAKEWREQILVEMNDVGMDAVEQGEIIAQLEIALDLATSRRESTEILLDLEAANAKLQDLQNQFTALWQELEQVEALISQLEAELAEFEAGGSGTGVK
jgi:peptidoglycan hydrolase CwlO-like protein